MANQINKIKPRRFGGVEFYGAGDQIVYSHLTSFVGPLSKSQRLKLRPARFRLLFCRTSSSHLTRPDE